MTVSSVSLSKDILANASQVLKPQGGQNKTDFGDHLKTALTQVSALQAQSSAVTQAYEAGDEVDVTKVMLAREKSSLAFEATMQVRNKLLSAYKDIVSMPV